MINQSDILDGSYTNIDSDGFISSISLYKEGKILSSKTFIKNGDFPKFNIHNNVIELHTYNSNYLVSITHYNNDGEILYKSFYDHSKTCIKIIDINSKILYELIKFNGKIYEKFNFIDPPVKLTLINGQPIDKCEYCSNYDIKLDTNISSEYHNKYYKKYNFNVEVINYKIERHEIINNIFKMIRNNINYNYKVECNYFQNKLNGYFKDFKDNKNHTVRHYLGGLLHGNYTEYDNDNNVKLSIFYDNGIIHGSIHKYYKTTFKSFYFNTITSQCNDELKIHTHEFYDKGKLFQFINYNYNNENEPIILVHYINNKINYYNLNMSSNDLVSNIIKNKSLFVNLIDDYEYYNIEHCFYLEKNIIVVNKYLNIFTLDRDVYSIKILDMEDNLISQTLYKNDKIYKEIYPKNTIFGLPCIKIIDF